MELSIPSLGKVNIEPALDGHWAFRLDYSEHPVRLGFNVDGEMLTQGAVDTVARFVADLAAHDGLGRNAIRDDRARDGDGAVGLYVSHHLEQFNATELRACLGTDDPRAVGPDLFLSKLRLCSISLYPDDADERAVFDYTIGEALTDYVIAVRFDPLGKVVAVEMES